MTTYEVGATPQINKYGSDQIIKELKDETDALLHEVDESQVLRMGQERHVRFAIAMEDATMMDWKSGKLCFFVLTKGKYFLVECVAASMIRNAPSLTFSRLIHPCPTGACRTSSASALPRTLTRIVLRLVSQDS